MANTFKSHQTTGVTTETTVLTGAASTQTTIIGMSIANTGATDATASVKVNTAYLVKDAPIPVGGSLVVIGGDQKVVAEATDTISVSSDVTVDVITSVLEIT